MVESSLRMGGAVVFWTIGEWSQRSILKEGFEALRLEKFIPEARTPQAALRDALEECFGGSKFMVRPLKTKDGFTVVQEDRGEDANTYSNELVARINPDSLQISFAPFTDQVQAIVDSFNKHLGLLRSSQVSASLVNLLDALGGTRLRPSGAIYWLPEHRLDEWQGVAEVVERAGAGRPNAVYILRHHLDADAIRAVRDAIVAEVSGEAHRIEREVASGELGERALEHRQEEAGHLREKIALYEELLGVGLEQLHRAVDKADTAAGMAAILAAAQAGAACVNGAA